MNDATALADSIADLFDLDARREPVADFAADSRGIVRSADCTNNGCTNTCNGCNDQ